MKRKKIVDPNGIKFKLALRFLSLLAIILLLMWLLQLFLYDRIYRNIVSKDLYETSSTVEALYEQNKLSDIEKIARKNNYVYVFYTKIGTNVDVLYSTRKNPEELSERLIENSLRLSSETEVKYYFEENDSERFVCGKVDRIDGNLVYMYAACYTSISNQTTDVLTFTLLIITGVSIIVTIGVYLILAKDISQPITNLSRNAKQLSKGNLKVEFDSHNYTEVSNLSNSLNYAISEIRKSEEIQKDIVQNVSHELRTPLTMIRSYTEMLLDFSGENKQKRIEHLGVIKEQTDRLEHLVNDMIDLSKLQAKTMKFERLEFDFSKVLRQLGDNYEARYQKDGYVFNFDIQNDIIITADQKRVEQVVINLLNNAVNYSTDNKNIDVTLVKDKDVVKLTISDHGIGISPEDLKQIFNRHFRSEKAQIKGSGSGVGLAIVKEILDYHGYEIQAESEVNKGSKFTLLIR